MNKYNEFYRGVNACKRGDPCPENASDAFNRGYGIEWASGFMKGDRECEIEEYARRLYEDDFNQLMGETA